MKKTLVIWLWLFCLSLMISSCEGCENTRPAPLPQKVDITASAYSELYINMMNPTGSMPEYRVKVVIKNGDQPLKFDKVVAVFIPSQGQPLVQPTIKYVEGQDQTPGTTGELEPFILQPQESEEFNYQTNGYTMDLLADVGDYPLQFSITLMYQDKAIIGPYHANLPDLAQLPSYDKSLSEGKELKATQLEFF